MPQFEGGVEGRRLLIAGLASSIDELAAFVNRSLFAMRTYQAQPGDREIRYFMTQQIDEVGKRGLVDGGYFTVGEIVVALRTAENPARHRVPPRRRNRDSPPGHTQQRIFGKRMGGTGTSRSHALGTSYAQETVARSWARRRVVY